MFFVLTDVKDAEPMDKTVQDQITERLKAKFKPQHLDVRDVSAGHAGHMGARPGGETHFEIDIRADAFAAMSLVQRHRAINQLLADLLAGPIHALQIDAQPAKET